MHDFAFSLSTLLILVPACTGLICMSMPSLRGGAWTSLIGFAIQAALLVLGVVILSGHSTTHVQLAESTTWFRQWHIDYSVQLTQVPVVLASLAALVTFCATMFTVYAKRERGHVLQGLLWLALAALTGLFLSRDLVLFYTFFELMLVPLLFALGGWGGAQRIRATLTMFVYTLAGSLLMLVGVISVGVRAHTFDLSKLAVAGSHSGTFTWWMFMAFVVAFAVKAPLLGVHGWLPISYREAPAEVTAVLSGLVSKAAMFGFLVVVLPLFPDYIAGTWGKGLIWVAIAGLLYGSVCAFRQQDARGVVAYSSLAQMSLIVLGLLVVSGPGGLQGLNGALLQAVNHGLISAALFLTIGVVEQRLGSSQLDKLGGLGVGRPVLYTLTLIVTMCTLAVPGSNAFGGEILILVGAFRGPWAHAWIWSSVASIGIVLAAMYALRLFSAIMHTPGRAHDDAGADAGHTDEGADAHGGEQPQSPASKLFGGDLRWGEALAVIPIVLALLALSVWPNALHGAYRHPTPVAVAQPADTPGGAQ